MSEELTCWIDNDNLLTIEDLVDLGDGQPIEGAAVEITLKDEDGAFVGVSADWPLVMTEVDPAKYQATLLNTLELVPARYLGTLKIVTVAGGVGSFECNIRARVRKVGRR